MTFECANYFSLSCMPTADYQMDQTLMLYKGHLMCLADPWPVFYTLKFLKFLLVHGVFLLQNHNTYYSWANFPHIYMNFVAPLSKLTLSVRNELVYGHTKCFSLKEGRIVLIMSYAEFSLKLNFCFSPNFSHDHDQWAVPVMLAIHAMCRQHVAPLGCSLSKIKPKEMRLIWNKRICHRVHSNESHSFSVSSAIH